MSKKSLIKRIGIILLLIIIIPLSILYIWSTVIIDKTYSFPLVKVNIPADTASVHEGERLVHIAHCSHCHGEKFTGGIVSKEDYVGEVIGPDITEIIPQYSNEELVRLLKTGVKKNGESVFVMPSFSYHNLKDASIADIIAYLRTLQPVPAAAGLDASSTLYPLGRLQIIEGDVTTISASADMAYCNKIHLNANDTSQVAEGRYLVTCNCTSCHAPDLKGRKGFSPDLIIVTAYSRAQFLHLLHTGEGALGRKYVNMMSDIAKHNLCYLHDDEMNAIYAYLQTKPTQKK
jgi:mono/diheme cytochrome c family protein